MQKRDTFRVSRALYSNSLNQCVLKTSSFLVSSLLININWSNATLGIATTIHFLRNLGHEKWKQICKASVIVLYLRFLKKYINISDSYQGSCTFSLHTFPTTFIITFSRKKRVTPLEPGFVVPKAPGKCTACVRLGARALGHLRGAEWGGGA